MSISISGVLPVAIKKVVGNETISLKAVRMTAITGRASLQAQAALKPGEFPEPAKVCACTQLLSEDGEQAYQLEYAELVDSSAQNMDYLFDLKFQLDAKERAES